MKAIAQVDRQVGGKGGKLLYMRTTARQHRSNRRRTSSAPKNVILSSDSGVSVLPLPHISFSKFIKIIINFGFSKKEINYMIKINSKKLFNL